MCRQARIVDAERRLDGRAIIARPCRGLGGGSHQQAASVYTDALFAINVSAYNAAMRFQRFFHVNRF